MLHQVQILFYIFGILQIWDMIIVCLKHHIFNPYLIQFGVAIVS